MKAHEMIARVRDLPPVSSAALRLISLLNDADSGNEEIVQIIKEDMVLTGKLLRACNSSALGLGEQVTSVDQAVLLLGQNQIYRIIMAMSFRRPMDIPLQAYAMEVGDLWQHSLLAAKAAELAVVEGIDLGVDSSTAFTIGLLHDIGKLITSQFVTRQSLISIRHEIAKGRTAIESERDILQTDHAEVGAALAYLWRLPNPIIEAIGLHHTPPVRQVACPAIAAYFANRVAHRSAAFLDQHELPALPGEPRIFENLGLSDDKLQSLVEKVVESSAETEEWVAVSC